MPQSVRRLFDDFEPSHYDLKLDLDLVTNIARGQVTIRGSKKGRPSQRLTFHGKSLTVTKASIAKRDRKGATIDEIAVSRINMQKSFDEIRLHTEGKLFAGDYTVYMEFEAPIQDSMHGIYRSRYKHDGQEKQVISTQFESHHAREAFPCIDEPEAKAMYDLTLITPAGQTVIANMPATSQDESDGRLTSVFKTSPHMSTYLLAFAVGDFQHKTTQTKDGVSVSVYATTAHKAEALDFAVDTTRRSIEFFNDYYGVPYPLPKCDMVAIPDFSSAAMENWGLVTYREPYILADPETASQSSRELIAMVIAHEISHQWFGNLVTMKWWDDLWLNESFANVMEYVAVDAMFPEWHIFNTFVSMEGLAAFRRDSIAGVQSIKTPVRHPDEIHTLFDPSIVYAKGGRLLNMLRTYIGEDDFRAGLKEYFDTHQYGNTTGDDLWRALGDASGKDVAGFMEPWLLQSGFPMVSVRQEGDAIDVRQQHFLMDPAKADAGRSWPVPLLATDSNVPPLLDGRSLSATAGPAGYVRLNEGAVGHYIVHYETPKHRDWLAGLAGSRDALTEAERLMLLSDSAMLGRSGVQSFADTLRLLEHYADEDSEPVWDTIALIIADSRRFIDADPSLEDRIKALIRRLIGPQHQRLGWDERPGEPSQDTKLRATILGLGTYAEHPEIKDRMLAKFDDYRQDAASVASELRGIVFSSAVRYAKPGAFDYLLQLEESTGNPDLKQELLGSLGATRSTDEGRVLLDRIKDTSRVRAHDVDHWVVVLMRNRQNQEQTWQWLRDNWDWVKRTFSGDKTYDSFPRYAASALNTRQRLEEYRDFFGPKTDEPVLTRNITMGIEELENRVAWIERDLDAVRAVFASYDT